MLILQALDFESKSECQSFKSVIEFVCKESRREDHLRSRQLPNDQRRSEFLEDLVGLPLIKRNQHGREERKRRN